MNLSKLLLLMCFTLFSLRLPAADQKKSELPPDERWVSLGKDGRLKYRADQLGNRTPDFSMVGYETGNVPLPGMPGGVVVPTKVTLEPGDGDQTKRIQDAIDQLAKLPVQTNGYRGALLLKRGDYPCSGTVRLNASGIVLRGEGDDLKTGTILRDTGNWAIGCKAGAFTSSGPERGAKKLPGHFESNDHPLAIRSLYEAQLAKRKKRASMK